MNVNATGVFLGTKCAVPTMIANGGGSIVNLSSIAGIIGSEGKGDITAPGSAP